MTRGPEGPEGHQPKWTQKTIICLGAPHCSLSMSPRGSCYACVFISTCIFLYVRRERERNVLFNDALNTFYLRLYGVRHIMVKDHSDIEKGKPLPPHRLLLSINSKGSFICTIPYRITHTTAFVKQVVDHWLEREIAQWVHPMKDRSDDPSHYERTLYLRATCRSLYVRKYSV